jgi:hypothetical protein
MRTNFLVCAALAAAAFVATTTAQAYNFSTNATDGAMAMASRPDGATEIEAADDFITTTQSSIYHATFTGLLTGTSGVSGVGDVTIELYRIFPLDSDTIRTPNVPTRANSPSDVVFDSRSSSTPDLTFTTSLLSTSFLASNSVRDGINPKPNQTTGGDGAITGPEVRFDVTFTTPFDLPADHYFFIPQVQVTGGDFYWLSSARPIVTPPGTPFAPDLQAWIRDSGLDPDWLRVGTDIVGGTTPPTFNGTFTLDGTEVPEPASIGLLGLGTAALLLRKKRGR